MEQQITSLSIERSDRKHCREGGTTGREGRASTSSRD